VVGQFALSSKDRMPDLLIPDIEPELYSLLAASAAAHRRSLEEEARDLLRDVARQHAPGRENLVAVARRLFGPEHGVELEIPPRGSAPERRSPDFSRLERPGQLTLDPDPLRTVSLDHSSAVKFLLRARVFTFCHRSSVFRNYDGLRKRARKNPITPVMAK
jgi:plasmid stability protein